MHREAVWDASCGNFLAATIDVTATPAMQAALPSATRIALHLTANSVEVLRTRYLRKNDRGQIVETPEEMFARVASHVAEVESRYGGDAATVASAFYDAMARLEFLPNSPTLMNAGTRLGQLAACFVLPVAEGVTLCRACGFSSTS